jgi:hypothetical protein
MPLNLSRLEEQMILSYHRNSELAWRWNSKGTFTSSFRCCSDRRLLMVLPFLHKDLSTDSCKRLLAFTNRRYYDIIDYLLTQEKNCLEQLSKTDAQNGRTRMYRRRSGSTHRRSNERNFSGRHALAPTWLHFRRWRRSFLKNSRNKSFLYKD